MYAEVVVDRPIVKRDRRTFVDAPEDADVLFPEVELSQETGRPHEPAPDPNPLALTFHYHIPAHLLDQLRIGHLVAVPFRTQQLPAIVVRLSDRSPVEATKPIAAILDPVPVVTPAQIKLAYWLSYEYPAPLSVCLKYFLPPGASRKPEWILKPVAGAKPPQGGLKAPEQILLTYLRQHGQVPLTDVQESTAERLIGHGLAVKEARLGQPRVGAKMDRMVELLIAPDEVEAMIPSLGRASKQVEVLDHLVDLNDPLPLLDDVLAAVGCSKGPVQALAEKGHVEIIPAQTRLALSRAGQSRRFDDTQLSEAERTVFDYLRPFKHPVPLDEIVAATGVSQATIKVLFDQAHLLRFDEAARVTLTLDPADLAETIIELRGSQRHAEVLRLLAEEDSPVWIGWIYAQTEATLKTVRDLEGAGLVSINEARRWRDPLAQQSFALDSPPKMTLEQQAVWDEVREQWQPNFDDRRPILLHGVTGSGKTEIYLRAIAAALRAGQGAIFLVPEITLAAQTVKRVAARFPGKVAVWHSALSPGERYDTWERVRSGELQIVVGPRSALFAPISNLGVIVVDEEHEPVYKQRDRAPIYHARAAAIEL
ncbi:MAG: DEAD/DEAH box helicase, partial [Anaerolineae bacterium]|nr:DEAD/DEAH box helicase [Anaerolineae bacterium]